MVNDVERWERHVATKAALAGVKPEPAPAESALMLWAKDAHQANQIAKMLASTSFVPASLRGKPEDLTAALLAGQELGLQPMATLRSIDIIQGTPALRAHAMRGLVQARGYDVEVVESDDQHCVMRGRRGASAGWQSVTWDLDRAKRLGLTSKDQWQKQPRTMLIARATGEICRLIAADVLYAMPYAAEELDEQGPPVRATATVTAADLLADMPTPAVEMPRAPRGHGDPGQDTATLPADISTEPDETPEPQGITGPQMRKLQALFKEAGIDDRGSRLAWASDVAGRELATSSDLTRVEAGNVIEAVEAFIAERVEAAAERERQIAGEIPQWPELT